MQDLWQDEEDFEEDFGLADRQQTALNSLQAAWEEALEQGVEQDILIETSLFAALSQIILQSSEGAAADYCAKLPERIENGEFTLYRVLN
uniref:hypothetical protein n=1 Tax=Pararhizobium sp. IMCC3301 TaxID=3067904 RepID=UPI002740D52B|nr:hypothetical protein [Pararhizobium sp. IMCC3301]